MYPAPHFPLEIQAHIIWETDFEMSICDTVWKECKFLQERKLAWKQKWYLRQQKMILCVWGSNIWFWRNVSFADGSHKSLYKGNWGWRIGQFWNGLEEKPPFHETATIVWSACLPESKRQEHGGATAPDSKRGNSLNVVYSPPSVSVAVELSFCFCLTMKRSSGRHLRSKLCWNCSSALLWFLLRAYPVKLPGNVPETSQLLCLSGRCSASHRERCLPEMESNLCRIQHRQKCCVTISSCLQDL